MEIDEFGRGLMEKVRDPAIDDCDRLPATKGLAGARMRAAALSETAQKYVVPDVVDSVLFYLLKAIDNGDLSISWRSADGRMVDLTQEGQGELAGLLAGDDPDAWRPRFSKRRYF
jgi:hypothetical protein